MDTRLQPLAAPEAAAAYDFCVRDPDRCSFLAGWIHEGGLSQSAAVPRGWLLAERGPRGEIRGLAYVSATGIVLPVLRSEAALEPLVDLARTNPDLVRVVLGERTLVEALWRRLLPLGLRARLVRDQQAYTLRAGRLEPSWGRPLPLGVADERVLDDLVAASAAMAREEAQDDPQARNPDLFRERIRSRLSRGRDFVHCEDGRLVFKVNVSAISPLAGQIEGVYTVPGQRRRHLGLRGVGTISGWILERAERAVLLVNDDNGPARRLYERLGFEPSYSSRTIFLG